MGNLLDSIHSPADLRKLSVAQLESLAQEIRERLIVTLSKTGGHLGPNLGVVELTLALHTVFETPKDKFVFDVSHQAYVHKMLTGRCDRFGAVVAHTEIMFRLNVHRSGRHLPVLRFRQRWAWLWRATLRAGKNT